ncbi:pentatricopeptide repeat-containing protein At2g30100, chloroplastic [Magnolia sinica]|uniref:pentatricopeptide repeat-containing protein At2g30100, chloroplastic n=1 Tax=Magnolia sinica TaxID=86752 RepID=UPI002659FAF2|nr:pentatricopeptide repeat-containing protein At2g30100, chloroplastic [Magnolia sinica]
MFLSISGCNTNFLQNKYTTTTEPTVATLLLTKPKTSAKSEPWKEEQKRKSMATIHRFMSSTMMRPTLPLPHSPSHHQFLTRNISTNSCSISTSHNLPNPKYQTARKTGPPRSVELDRIPSTSNDSGSDEMMSEGFFEAIEELERMAREPADILEAMHGRLSDRELHLVLVYFSQEGRDSWCALEVFDWLRKENRADSETVELMVTIMCGWVDKMVQGDHAVGDVVGLLKDMECVGLTPRFSMIEKVISVYWEVGKKAEAVMFVRDVLERGVDYTVDGGESNRGGPTGYLAWKMMVDGDYLGAVKLVIEFKESGLKPEVYSYLIAMTALVKEQNEFSKALRKLKGSMKDGLIPKLDTEDMGLIEKYQSGLIQDGVRLSDWAIQEGSSGLLGLVHERLLAMYTCAGRGLEAERQLWHMKLAGKEPDRELYDIVLAICASQKEDGSVRRLLARMEAMNLVPGKKTLSWLLRGYIKGGYFEDASKTLTKMLDLGLNPEYLDRVAVLQGLRKIIQQSGNVEPYLNLCKRLADVDLIGPCLVYLYISGYRLWVIKMV